MIISIKQEHIDNGVMCDSQYCMLARAVKDTDEYRDDMYFCVVTRTRLIIKAQKIDGEYWVHKIYHLSIPLQYKLSDFDEGKDIQPFKVHLFYSEKNDRLEADVYKG